MFRKDGLWLPSERLSALHMSCVLKKSRPELKCSVLLPQKDNHTCQTKRAMFRPLMRHLSFECRVSILGA